MLNVRHLELFYYVARYMGIARAKRHMPLALSQPAISNQIRLLEESLGVELYRRRPFALTAVGERLYAQLRLGFDGLPALVAEIRGSRPQIVRFGASLVVLEEYLPEVLERVGRQFPGLTFAFTDGLQEELHQRLVTGELDVAVMVTGPLRIEGVRVESLISVPLILLVPASSGIREAAELWQGGRATQPLIGLPPGEGITRIFQETLRRQGVEWPVLHQVTSLQATASLTRRGHGVGLSVALPGKRVPDGLRALPLPGFPSLQIGLCWRSGVHPVVDTLLAELRKKALALGACH